MRTRLLLAALACLLAACASVNKVESGQRLLGERLSLTLEGAWNHVDVPGPAQIWTMEGLPIDQLLLYPGLKDGALLHTANRDGTAKSFAFRASMQPDEIVALFEGMLTRDGSAFKLVRLEPAHFGGVPGFRFEYSLTRKIDNVQLSGFGYGAVDRRELYAAVYMAPRLSFYARHQARVEQIARSARLKG